MTSPMHVGRTGIAAISYDTESPTGRHCQRHCAVGSSRSDAARHFASLLRKAISRGQTVGWGDVEVRRELERGGDDDDDDSRGTIVAVQVTTSLKSGRAVRRRLGVVRK